MGSRKATGQEVQTVRRPTPPSPFPTKGVGRHPFPTRRRCYRRRLNLATVLVGAAFVALLAGLHCVGVRDYRMAVLLTIVAVCGLWLADRTERGL